MKSQSILYKLKEQLSVRRKHQFFAVFLMGLAILSAFCGCTTSSSTQDSPPEVVVKTVPKTEDSYRVNGQWYHPIPDSAGFSQSGIASWYGAPFHGKKTANGEIYNMNARTAAHKILPLGTFVLVRSVDTNKETIVRINDRGPFVPGRIIDLSYRAAEEIGMIGPGTANVEIFVLEKGLPETGHADFYTGDFTVQIGAFANKSHAENLCNELRTYDAQVFMESVMRESKTFYRVRVGRFTSLTSAKAAEARLLEAGYSGAFAVASD